MTKVLDFSIKFDQATIGHAVIDNRTGHFVQFNQRFCELIGFEREAAKEITFLDIVHPNDLHDKMQDIQKILSGGVQEITVEKFFTREDGSVIWFNLSLSALDQCSEPYYHLVILEDITARKRAEQELKKTNKMLDQRVAERTAELHAKIQEMECINRVLKEHEQELECTNRVLKEHEQELCDKNQALQELNSALKVLIHKQEEVRGEIGEDLLGTIKIAVEPSLKKLAKICPDEKQQKIIAVIEAHLKEVIKPLPRELAARNLTLTKTETTVADLIKNGFSNKQVAEHLNISIETVAFHRKNIRRKLGLNNKRTSLATYLQNLTQG